MNKMPIRRRIAVTKRGFALLKRYCPGLIQEEAWCAFVSCIQPFLLVWLSARLINEISAQRRIRVTVLYAAGMLVAQFTCSVLQKMLHKLCEEKQSQMWDWFGKIFSDKQMSMDFSDLENAAVQRQRQQAEENLYMFGNGLAQLVWGVPSLVRSGVNILVSLWMGASLFVSRSGSGLIDHPAWIFILLLCIVLGGMSHSKATIKENEVFMRWCSGTVWFNRAFMFFGKELYMNPERAKDVRIYGQSALASKVLDKLIQTDRENRADTFKMSIYPAAAAAAIGLTNAVCYLFIAVKAFFGAFGAGNAVQYMAALSRLGGGLQELMYLLSDNAVYCLHLQKLFEYLDLPDRMYQGSLTVEKRDDDAYDIEFRNVSFRYPNAGGYALRHISLKLKAGEKLAVVGMNGSGKTTFIKLLCRLYDPTEGEILLNGVNIQKYDYDEYLSLFSVVFQDFRLFSFGLGQNIAASAAYDRERAEACLKKTGFGGRLAAMPGGMETCLYRDFDTGGVEISGGEAQKIALARALYKEAPFIILDEPTAALDPVSECGVYRLFDEIAGSRTAIYISHRLASCRFCDEIAVFHEGRIVQQGTHEQLVACRLGRYYELWNAQAQYYKEQDG